MRPQINAGTPNTIYVYFSGLSCKLRNQNGIIINRKMKFIDAFMEMQI